MTVNTSDLPHPRGKRWRILPDVEAGWLKVQYGKAERRDGPDIVFRWTAPADGRDSALLYYFLNHKPHNDTHRLSLLEELEARGFDLATLKIEIKRKDAV